MTARQCYAATYAFSLEAFGLLPRIIERVFVCGRVWARVPSRYPGSSAFLFQGPLHINAGYVCYGCLLHVHSSGVFAHWVSVECVVIVFGSNTCPEMKGLSCVICIGWSQAFKKFWSESVLGFAQKDCEQPENLVATVCNSTPCPLEPNEGQGGKGKLAETEHKNTKTVRLHCKRNTATHGEMLHHISRQ